MTEQDKLRESVAANLRAEQGDAVTGRFDDLLDAIVDIVLSLLSGCLLASKGDGDDVEMQLRFPRLVRTKVRREVRRDPGIRPDERDLAERTTMRTLNQSTTEQRAALMTELADG